MIKTLSKPGGGLPQCEEGHLQKPTANITLSGERLKLPVKARHRTRRPAPTTSSNTALEAPARQESETQSNWKGRSKLTLFSEDIILYIENPRESSKKNY